MGPELPSPSLGIASCYKAWFFAETYEGVYLANPFVPNGGNVRGTNSNVRIRDCLLLFGNSRTQGKRCRLHAILQPELRRHGVKLFLDSALADVQPLANLFVRSAERN